MAVGMFNSCEEKLPTIQNPGSLYDIDSLVVSADSMDFYRVVREPYIGTSDVLYIGNDENVFAYTLLKFTKINEYLPDAVENFKILSVFSYCCGVITNTAPMTVMTARLI